jgi:hypothetical protein
MRILFGLATAAVVAFTAWSVETTVGKTPSTDSLDPLGMMVNTAGLPQAHTAITAPFTERVLDHRIPGRLLQALFASLPSDQGVNTVTPRGCHARDE